MAAKDLWSAGAIPGPDSARIAAVGRLTRTQFADKAGPGPEGRALVAEPALLSADSLILVWLAPPAYRSQSVVLRCDMAVVEHAFRVEVGVFLRACGRAHVG